MSHTNHTVFPAPAELQYACLHQRHDTAVLSPLEMFVVSCLLPHGAKSFLLLQETHSRHTVFLL